MSTNAAIKVVGGDASDLESSKKLRGSNWIHGDLGLVEVAGCGFGVEATADIKQGTLLIMYGGAVITETEFEELPEELQHYPFQVADDLFLGPVGADDIGIGERVNHSCSPNAGFLGAIALVALRDISQGEAITFDYATCVASDDDAFQMQCRCSAPDCRRVITGNDWKIKDVQNRLLPHFQPFLQVKVRELDTGAGCEPRGRGIGAIEGHVRNNDSLSEDSAARRSRSRGFLGIVRDFLRESLRQDWAAVPICLLAGIPSTLATIGIMALLGTFMKTFGLADSQASYVAYFSILASIVSYATYLLFYYSGMLWKERGDFLAGGRINRTALYRKLTVVKYDFITHLPYDFWVMPLMGAATASFFVFGVSEWLSVLIVNTIADVAYAIKEPFFWHGAKKLAIWEENRRS